MPRLLLALVAVLAFTALLPGQTGVYEFDIDQDAISGAPDFGFLNRPLCQADRLFVRDGHFFRVGPDLKANTDDDGRVRLFGVNLAFTANFPDQADAVRIARRLRRLGVNIVRLHHMDSQPESASKAVLNGDSILTTGPYPSLNTAGISRLRHFLDALKAEGIYVDLNLHVGYQFVPAKDGVPAMPLNTPFPEQSKPLHILHPRMVELQAEFARKLIDALALRDDPVLGVVEINNESSLQASWQKTWEGVVVGEYREELQRQWNTFLAARYGTSEKLKAAWGPDMPDGPEILPGSWADLEIHGTASAILTRSGSEAKVEIRNGSDTIILKQINFSVATGHPYVAEVEMRADSPATVYWDVKRNVSPWETLKGSTVTVSNAWQKFSMIVPANFAIDGVGRFGISVEHVSGTIYVRNATLRQAGENSLADGESVEALNISTLGQNDRATIGRLNDWLLFLTDRDRAYLSQIVAAVREKAGPLVPITGTQINFGGLMNVDSHRDMDYDDSHFYVDHYVFPNRSWDGRDWKIADQSSVARAFREVLNLATARTAGRPFTISEFNQPWPNRQAAEHDPSLAAFASFQDWDGLMHFAYSHGRSWDAGVPNGFNLNGDWTKWVGFGQSAWIARSAAGIIGYAAGKKATAGAIEVETAAGARGFVTVVATALDGKPLTRSARILVSNPGATYRTQPGSDPARPQQLIPYSGGWTAEKDPSYPNSPSGDLNGGRKPVWMERIELNLTLRTQAAAITVYPLDGTGQRRRPLDAQFIERTPVGWRMHLQADGQEMSPWYEIEAGFSAEGRKRVHVPVYGKPR